MLKRLLILLLCGIITDRLGNAQKLSKAKKLNLKVHINATGDTLTMKFLRPNNNIKLEGFILGYGSNFFSNQYIQWPENGKSYVSEVDAEPRYLISLKPNENSKKSCKEKNSEKNSVQKPLQLVVGTLTPTSVFLSWGILINPQFDWSFLNKCPNDRFYTVRYREKNKDWLFQLCPTTETVIDNLKPNTVYEFGVKDNTDDGNWSKVFPHKTIPKSKENGQSQNTYKDTKDIIQMISKDTKAFIPIVLVKQGIQNLSNLALPKSESILPTTEQSPVVKVTEPPPTPKTSEEPDDEDIKPVPNETLKVTPPAPKTTVTTESSSSEFVPDITEKATESPSDEVPKIPQRMPINVIRLHIVEDPKFTSDVTEKDITPKPKEETESPSIAVSKVPKRMPINVIRLHIFEDPKVASEPETTEKPISHKPSKATQRPPSTAVPLVPDRMPINVIRVHLFEDQFEDPKVTSVPRETHTTLPPTPKTTKSNKLLRTKPVPNTTQVPLQPKTTQRTEQPQTKPVPNETQKVPSHKNKKNQQTPRSRPKPVSTESPKESSKPKIPPQSIVATLAPYKLQLSSSRPRTSVRPRTRPAQNGTSQGSLRSRPTGDFNWMTGIIPGGRSDNSKILGVSRNISMEPNNTGRKTYSVSSPPQLPVRPTSMRRRTPPNTVTGRPGSSGSILIPRAFATARPNRTSVTIKTPKKEPTTLPPKEDPIDNTVFSTAPISDVDALGKVRYTAPHVKYMRKEESVPCSITESLRYFPVEEATNQEITNPPQNPPSNLTIVTVEGCPSFVILDWEQPDNDTVTEYEVISQENGAPPGKETSIITTNQTYSTVENLKPDTSYEFKIIPKNPLGEGPVSTTLGFNTESADPKVSEPVTGGKDAIWTEIKFKSDSYSECKGKQFVKRTWYKKFVGIQLCNSLRYKIYLSDSLSGTFYNIGDQSGYGEDHCQFVDSFLDGRTGQQLLPEQLSTKKGFYRSVRQQPVEFGEIGGQTRISYVHWYECGISIPGKW